MWSVPNDVYQGVLKSCIAEGKVAQLEQKLKENAKLRNVIHA